GVVEADGVGPALPPSGPFAAPDGVSGPPVEQPVSGSSAAPASAASTERREAEAGAAGTSVASVGGVRTGGLEGTAEDLSLDGDRAAGGSSCDRPTVIVARPGPVTDRFRRRVRAAASAFPESNPPPVGMSNTISASE